MGQERKISLFFPWGRGKVGPWKDEQERVKKWRAVGTGESREEERRGETHKAPPTHHIFSV